MLAIASRNQPEYVYADIDVAMADNKRRPDGTDVFAARRPDLYKKIAEDPKQQSLPPMNGQAQVTAAVVQMEDSGSIQEACSRVAEAVSAGAALITLPPFIAKLSSHAEADLERAVVLGELVIEKLAEVCGDAYVATAVVRRIGGQAYQHSAILVSKNGLELVQAQVHRSKRFDFSVPTDQFHTLELPFATVALLCSDDSLYPETFRLLALAGVEVALVPLSPLEKWNLTTGLLER